MGLLIIYLPFSQLASLTRGVRDIFLLLWVHLIG